MNTESSIEIPVRNRLFCKLDPSRLARMSGVMAAIVGHLLDAPLGEPRIVEITVTSDGFVLGRTNAGANHYLIRNWSGLLAVAGLTTIERFEAEALSATKIGYLGRTTT